MIIVKRIMIFLVIIVLGIVKVLLNLIVKAECWVAGVGFLLLAIFASLALIKQMWLQLEIFGILFLAGFLILLFSVQIEVWLDGVFEKIREI